MAIVVGLFDNREQAQSAVEQLRSINVAAGDISVAMRSDDETSTESITDTGGAGAGAVTGAVSGGLLGGLAGLLVGVGALAIPGIGPVVAAGPLATALIGAGVGAATGGLVGALVDAGVPEEEARLYETGVQRGGVLVTIRVPDGQEGAARDILNSNGAHDLQTDDPLYTMGDDYSIGGDDVGGGGIVVGGSTGGSGGIDNMDGGSGTSGGDSYGDDMGGGLSLGGDDFHDSGEDGERGGEDRESTNGGSGNGGGGGFGNGGGGGFGNGGGGGSRNGGGGGSGSRGDEDSNEATQPATRTIERVASADFPPVVEPESENLLSYTIAREARRANVGRVGFTVPIEIKELNLVVSVQAPDFIVTDPDTGQTRNFHRVTLNCEDPDAEINGEFSLRARRTNVTLDTKVNLNFSYKGLPVGGIVIPTKITADAAGTPMDGSARIEGGLAVSANQAPAPDIVMRVDAAGDAAFQITVDRDARGPIQYYAKSLDSFPITGKAWDYAQSILEKFRMARTLKPPERRQTLIDNLGLDLWWNLPAAFRDFYWAEMHGQNLSIAIYSQEPYIPWELVKPQRTRGGETAPMLGLAFSMARWKTAARFPDPLVVTGFAVIAPQYTENPLKHNGDEAAELARIYGARLVPGQYIPVTDLLNSKDVQIVHFAGHGEFDPTSIDGQIKLTDQALHPFDLHSTTIGQNTRPMVFLNACEVGEQGWSLTQIGGWAHAFTDAGFSAFVGPYWAVNDRIAKKASLVFYQALAEKKTVGEAMQEIRRHFWEDEDMDYRYHPTWLAYTLHCQPNVTVDLKQKK
jgi:hypothetical protein